MQERRPTDAEFDLGERIEAYVKATPENQRPTLAGLIATEVAKYRAEQSECLVNVTHERNKLRERVKELEEKLTPDAILSSADVYMRNAVEVSERVLKLVIYSDQIDECPFGDTLQSIYRNLYARAGDKNNGEEG